MDYFKKAKDAATLAAKSASNAATLAAKSASNAATSAAKSAKIMYTENEVKYSKNAVNELNTLTLKLKDLTTKIDDLKLKIPTNTKEMESTQGNLKESKEKNALLNTESKKQIAKLQDEIDVIKKQIIKLQNEISVINADFNVKDKEINQKLKDLKAFLDNIEKLEKEKTQLETKIASTQKIADLLGKKEEELQKLKNSAAADGIYIRRSRSPARKRRSRSPARKRRSRSPARRMKSRSPARRMKSRSPARKVSRKLSLY